MRFFRFIPAVVTAAFLAGLLSCSSCSNTEAPVSDYWPTEGWRTSSPEEQGMDSEMLAKMQENILVRDLRIDSVQIIRNGYLVLDSCHHPFGEQDRHIIHSCTKSIMSLLIGIALDQGCIDSLDQPVLSFFPDRKVKNLSEEKKALTLRHLLTMSTGLDSRDSYLYRWEGLAGMRAAGDWTGYILDLPMAAEPGTRFDYSNMASFLLSSIITETTGRTALAFARENLFGPLGITDVRWPSDPRGNNIGWGEMRLQPLDLAKIGWLVLNGGRWEDRQIVPADYLEQAVSEQIDAGTLQRSYGFQWWVKEPGLFMALGYGGQYLIVSPEKNLVAVFTSALEDRQFYAPDTLFSSFITKSLVSDASLPENPEALSRLESLTERMARPAAAEIPAFPETASAVNGRIYDLKENRYGMTAVRFLFEGRTAEIHEFYGDKMVASSIGLDGLYRIHDGEGVAVKGQWEGNRRFRTIFAGLGEAWWCDQLTIFEGDSLRLVFRTSGGDNLTVSGRARSPE